MLIVSGTDNAEMMKFLRRLPASKLAARLIGNKALFTTGRLPLAPVIDGDLLPCPIAKLRKQTLTKPSIVGLTEDEGLLFGEVFFFKLITMDQINEVLFIMKILRFANHTWSKHMSRIFDSS